MTFNHRFMLPYARRNGEDDTRRSIAGHAGEMLGSPRGPRNFIMMLGSILPMRFISTLKTTLAHRASIDQQLTP
jgi:hypothetical protein